MSDQIAAAPPVHGTPNFGFNPGDAIVVTGAGSGIGAATAIRAAEMGLAVAGWDLDPGGLARTVETIVAAGGRASAHTCDVSDAAAVDAAMDASRALGPIRHLVNNAGPASSSGLPFETALMICVNSVRLVTESWLREPLPGATVVNTASVAGNLVGTSPDWYPTSKAAIMGYTRHLATYRSDVVRANAIAPGMTDTPRLTGFAASDLGQTILGRIPLHRMGSADDMAFAILFLSSPLSAYINGILVPVDGGWTIAQ